MATERELFEQAIQIDDAEERDRFLQEACDDSMRLRIQDLLAQTTSGGDFILNQKLEAKVVGAFPDKNADTLIGNYHLNEQIGEGGMGTVFSAEQRHPIRRSVAVKIVKKGLDSKEVVARFEAERQALAMMDHRCIAKVFDAGATPDGRPYFAMELVRGVPITKFCNDHRLSCRERLQLFVDVCLGVEHAHQKGIVHRDIKPSNILVTQVESKGVPKIIDFGVAKALYQPLTDHTVHTRTTQLIGTPTYMSPEQASLNAIDIDTRSDIYSLGVLLYELLTGSPPFDPQRLKKIDFEEFRRIIREEEPSKPSTKISSLGQDSDTVSRQRNTTSPELARLLKRDLDWICLKALEKDRDRRFATATEFARDIQRFLNHEPVLASPQNSWTRFRKFCRRNRTGVFTAGLVTSLLIFGSIGTAWGWITANDANKKLKSALKTAEDKTLLAQQREDEATQSKQAAVMERDNADAISSFFISDLLEAVAPSDAEGRGQDVSMLEVLTAAEARMDRESTGTGRFVDKPYVETILREAIARMYRELGEYEASERHFQRAIELREAATDSPVPQLLKTKLDLALAYKFQDKYDEAEPIYKDVLPQARNFEDEDPEHYLRCLTDYATMLVDRQQLDEAAPLFAEAIAKQKVHYGLEDRTTLITQLNFAKFFFAQRKFDESLEILEEIEPRVVKVSGPNDGLTLIILNDIASIYYSKKRYGKAIQYQERVVDGFRVFYGPKHPFTATGLNALGIYHMRSGDAEQARPHLEEALQLRKDKLGAGNVKALNTGMQLAICLADLEEFENAIELINQLVENGESDLDPGDWNRAALYEYQGKVYLAAKRWSDAEASYDKAYDKYVETVGAENRVTKEIAAEGWELVTDWSANEPSQLVNERMKVWDKRTSR